MLVCIDESGCTGFKEASSKYFIISMVVFRGVEHGGRYPKAEKTAQAIAEAMSELRQKPEFHFTQCNHKVRMGFFNKLNASDCDFEVYALVVNKENITSHHLKQNPQKFYNFILKQLLDHNPIHNANLKIDGQKSREFRKTLKSYLNKGNGEAIIKKLKLVDSNKDYLIQLADMVCGAIAYSYTRQDKLNSQEYKARLGNRIKNIWEFK